MINVLVCLLDYLIDFTLNMIYVFLRKGKRSSPCDLISNQFIYYDLLLLFY